MLDGSPRRSQLHQAVVVDGTRTERLGTTRFISIVGHDACTAIANTSAATPFEERVEAVRAVIANNVTSWNVPADEFEIDMTVTALVGTGCPIWTNEVANYLDNNRRYR